jgi:serine/threonine protein phosphatase PrpC
MGVSESGEALLRSAGRSDVGRTRRDNQDAHAEFESSSGERLWIVADGMGGHVGGATASRICVEALGEVFVDSLDPPGHRLRRGLATANARIRETAERNPDLMGMGTTAVALALQGDRGWLGWVGDSRAYRARGGVLEALSHDHSLVAEWVRTGVLEPAEAETHPRRNELLRALGAAPEVECEVRELEVRPGDRFLLCSDGLSSVVPESEIAAVVTLEAPELATQKLVALANQHGGPDNVTAVVVQVAERALRAAPASRATPRIGWWLAALAALAAACGALRYAGFWE